jgi:hypothetical protein
MRPIAREIIGKKIKGVVVKEGHNPESQVFLIFSDGTYYEFYSDSFIRGSGRIHKGGRKKVKEYSDQNRVVLDLIEPVIA